MFSLDTDNPRWRSWLRTAQYALLTFLVVAGTIILVLAGQGYDFDRSSGEIIQNGLLLVNSRPENAQLTINGQVESDLTPGRFPLPTGDYELSLSLEGYQPWSKKINVAPNSVEWVYYPLLIPSELSSERVGVWRDLSFVSQSFDAGRVLVRQASDEPVFRLLELDEQSISSDEALELPASVAGNNIGTFAALEWSGNSRFVLLTHKRGSTTQFIRLDTEQPNESVNLSTFFDLSLSELQFIDSNPNNLYGLSGGDLRRLDINAQTISAPLVREVADFALMRDQFLLYLATTDGQLQLGLIDGDNPPKILESNLDGSASRYRVDIGEFDRQLHVALLDTRTDEVRIWRDPHTTQDAKPMTQISASGAAELTFSRNGQFVLAQGGGSFASYDLDRDREFHFETPFAKGSDELAVWMDGYRLLGFDKANLMHVFEFDGTNALPLVRAEPNLGIFFAGDFRGMYSVAPPDKSRNSFLMYTPFIVPSD